MNSIVELKAAIEKLNGLASIEGSVADSIADEIGTQNTAADGETSNATGLWAGIETALSTAVSDLETELKDGVSTDFDTLAEIATKLGTLQSAIDTLNGSETGSVSKSISDAIGTQNTAADGETSNATGLWAGIETALSTAISGVQTQIDAINSNSDLIDLNSIAELKAAVEILNGLASIEGSVADSIADAIAPLQASIDKLFALVGPDAPAVSIDNVTGNITVSVNDSDGVTAIKIYDGSTDVTSTYFDTPAVDTSADPDVYVFTPKAGVELDATAFTVKAVVTVGTGSDTQDFESIAGTTLSYSFDNVAPLAPSLMADGDGFQVTAGAAVAITIDGGSALTAGGIANYFTVTSSNGFDVYHAKEGAFDGETIAVSASTSDAAGNTASASAPLSLKIDTTSGPTIEDIRISSAVGVENGVLTAGDIVTITVTFSNFVTVSGAPTLGIEVGTAGKSAAYAGGSGTNQLYFNYTVSSSDPMDSDGIAIPAGDIALNGGSIIGFDSVAASLTHSGAAANANFEVNTSDTTASITLNSVAGDNAINAEEVADGVIISGVADAGSQVTLKWGNSSSDASTAPIIEVVEASSVSGRWSLYLGDGDISAEPPHLNWSSAMFRKRRTDNDEQTTEAGRDYHEVEAS